MIQTQRNVIGVTGACMMTSRDNFEKIGRFDESHSVINNDVDFCLRSWEKGFRVVYTPHTRLIHYEETSRSSLKNAYNSLRFDNIWKTRFALGDPFANPSIAAEIEHENAEYRPEAEPTRAICVGHPLISLPDVKRILAVKLDHIGDFILALPAFERLRERFPTAEITALVGKSSASLARATPSIDRVIEFAFFHTRSGKGRVRLTQKLLADLQRRLASFRFDIAIDLRQHMDTRYILRAAGATWLAGYDVRGEAGWLDVILELVNDIERQEKRAHLSDSLIHLVEAVATACNPTRSVFRGASQAEARQVVASLPSLASLTDKMFSAPLVCIHPGVGVATRQWPPEYFALLIDLLVEGEGVCAVLIGSPDKSGVVNKVLGRVKNIEAAVSLVGKTAVIDLPHILQQAICSLATTMWAASLGRRSGRPNDRDSCWRGRC